MSEYKMSGYKYDLFIGKIDKAPSNHGCFIYDQSQNKLFFYKKGSFFLEMI
jgi:hypothetical protein